MQIPYNTGKERYWTGSISSLLWQSGCLRPFSTINSISPHMRALALSGLLLRGEKSYRAAIYRHKSIRVSLIDRPDVKVNQNGHYLAISAFPTTCDFLETI